jgi:hypothetical protein
MFIIIITIIITPLPGNRITEGVLLGFLLARLPLFAFRDRVIDVPGTVSGSS